MCFSAKASFIAATGLSTIGILSIKKASPTKVMPFASTPLFFGIQQACEGAVWITLNNGDSTSSIHLISVYMFLFFAGIFWPIWISYSLYWAENSYKRKKIIFYFIYGGIIVSFLYFIAWILKTDGAIITHHHIDYPVKKYPFGITNQLYAKIISYFLSFSYGIVTIIPLFVSSLPYTKLLGFSIAIGAIISYLFYLLAFPSVWCFFAAISSVIIYFSVKKRLSSENLL